MDQRISIVILAHNVPTTDEVDAMLATRRAAGAQVTGTAERDGGGDTGYVTDPDGFRWEVAFNPGPIGQVVLP